MEVQKSFFTTVDHPFSIEKTEAVTCNFCASESYRHLGTELDYGIRECSSCGLVYVSPQPTADEIPAFYDSMYLDDSPEEVAARGLGYTERQIRGIVERRKPEGGQFLDIGCGFGAVLEEMAGRNWELSGIEIGPKAIAHARKRVSTATIFEGTLDEVDFPPGTFDCITMIAVLEHVKDPKAALERVYGWLSEGGLLVVQVPQVASFIRLKRHIPAIPIAFEAPRHLFDFSQKTLGQYMDHLGCRATKIEIALPYATGSLWTEALLWAIKLCGIAMYRVTLGRYLWPFSGGIVAHGLKPSGQAPAATIS